ncbi:M18 family aminopeptidase [Pseudoflavonifractor sp. MSJ-37]|uniref:M18 family aminopeptidase n=1 Tax=Pseudoflavonifractor sp. MSJ-37 TaxID=2841531 RepID=UPI001C1276AC|nr:M18 family aminopeptidase [Pseudoflavonifractor sp. MSJ-37]MBU5434275.1 M18 family aminopeptidase [Pseudoflavonifractor sp. MSJ-37]
MDQQTQSIFDFLDAGVSPWHAAAESVRRLEAAGYVRLEETDRWRIAPGGRYYVTRNGSAVAAFRVPEGAVEGWRIALSHSDAPTWRIKNSGVEQAPSGCVKLETEGYGGMLMGTWLDRPLGVAGRAVVRTKEGLSSRTVHLDRDLLVIPSVAIHFDRGVNEGRRWDPQTDLQPLWGQIGCPPLEDLIAAELGVAREDLMTWDLELVTRQKAALIGPEGEFFLSPRIDDLECAGTTLEGFLQAGSTPDGTLVLWGMLDNEEVGSSSRQGAEGTFLMDTLERLLHALGQGREDLRRCAANGLVLSADNGHAVHPDHPEKSDPQNGPKLNGGVVVKINASQKYTTDAVSAALFGEICRRAGVPIQRFANRADMPGGSTLGNLQGHSLSSPMLDIGLAQLAMHSAVETAGTADIGHMIRAVRAFCETPFQCVDDGQYRI